MLEESNDSELVAPYFFHPKAKMNRIRLLGDIWDLNRKLKLKPYPMPKIWEILLKLEGFTCATSLELNMVYYPIFLSKEASNWCNIILPLVNYKYRHLPMGVCNSLKFFQDKINEMFRGIEFIRAYINDLFIITKGDWVQ